VPSSQAAGNISADEKEAVMMGSDSRGRRRFVSIARACLLFAPLLIVLVAAACGGPPVATLGADATSGQAPLKVTFANTSQNATEFRWDFGDGATIATVKPTDPASHEYTKAGAYTVTLTAVKKGDPPETNAASVTVAVGPGALDHVTIEPTALSLEAAKESQFTGKAFDRFNNPIPDLKPAFKADDKAGAVDASGKFTAGRKAGAYDSGLTMEFAQGTVSKNATVKVTVNPGPLDHVTIQPTAATLEVTKGQQFGAAAFDQFDNPLADLRPAFRAEGDAGKVESSGALTAGTKVGAFDRGVSVEFTQGAISKSATARVALQHGPLDKITLEPTAVTLDIAKGQAFTVKAVDAYGNLTPEAQVAWAADENVGKLSPNGELTTGTKAGTFAQGVKVTVTLGSVTKEAVASVTVKPGPAVGLTVAALELAAGATQQLQAVAADQFGNAVGEVPVIWAVKKADAGAITANGAFTASKVAARYTDVIEARGAQGGKTLVTTALVTINPGPLEQVVVAPNPIELGMGMTQQFVAVGADRYGNRLSGVAFTWSVESSGGTMTPQGLFTASNTPGTYNRTVKATGKLGSAAKDAVATVTVEPDRIAFVSNREANSSTIYLVNADGSSVKPVIGGLSPSWTPDGRRIVSSAVSAIGIANDDGSWSMTIVASSSTTVVYDGPSLSPDGSKVAFHQATVTGSGSTIAIADYKIVVADADGGNLKVLSTITGREDISPTWTPDGTRIVFRSRPVGGTSDIWVMNADGSNRRQLTTHTATDIDPSVSPDGTRIAFVSSRDGDGEIFVMDIDGGNVRQITFNTATEDGPSWSPDSARIVFDSLRDGNWEIYVINADGTGEIRLTNNAARDDFPKWAPRKRGVFVSADAIIIPNTEALPAMTTQEIANRVRAATVRIENGSGGGGSGFIIDSDGLVVTANHVITDAKTITVFLDDGRRFTATIIGRDLVRDLALLRIPATGLPSLELGDISQTALGSDVFVGGYPLGLSGFTINKGQASSIKYDTGRNGYVVQMDATINPGNSGGPLLNPRGQVIGVIRSVITGADGVKLATSINTLRTYLERLKKGETITG
jgi:Tol biopolymer transport system component